MISASILTCVISIQLNGCGKPLVIDADSAQNPCSIRAEKLLCEPGLSGNPITLYLSAQLHLVDVSASQALYEVGKMVT